MISEAALPILVSRAALAESLIDILGVIELLLRIVYIRRWCPKQNQVRSIVHRWCSCKQTKKTADWTAVRDSNAVNNFQCPLKGRTYINQFYRQSKPPAERVVFDFVFFQQPINASIFCLQKLFYIALNEQAPWSQMYNLNCILLLIYRKGIYFQIYMTCFCIL